MHSNLESRSPLAHRVDFLLSRSHFESVSNNVGNTRLGVEGSLGIVGGHVVVDVLVCGNGFSGRYDAWILQVEYG